MTSRIRAESIRCRSKPLTDNPPNAESAASFWRRGGKIL
jgi:hypothetical protein